MGDRYIIAILANPVAGREATFNTWYDDIPLRDILAIRGILTAQCYRLAPVQHIDTPYPFGNFAFAAL